MGGRQIRPWVSGLVGWLIVNGFVTAASPVTPSYFQTAGELVAGAGRLSPAVTNSTLSIEIGESLLFGAAGLRSDGFRIGYKGERLGWFVSGTNVNCPLGSEKTGALGGFINMPGDVQAGWRLGGTLVDVPPCERSGLATWSGSLAAELSDLVKTGCWIENVRLAGEHFPGADVNLWTAVRPIPTASLTVAVRLSRWGELETGFAVELAMSQMFTAGLGYDNASGQVKTALSLSSGAVGCGLGAMFHPVLGVSKVITLGWRR